MENPIIRRSFHKPTSSHHHSMMRWSIIGHGDLPHQASLSITKPYRFYRSYSSWWSIMVFLPVQHSLSLTIPCGAGRAQVLWAAAFVVGAQGTGPTGISWADQLMKHWFIVYWPTGDGFEQVDFFDEGNYWWMVKDGWSTLKHYKLFSDSLEGL